MLHDIFISSKSLIVFISKNVPFCILIVSIIGIIIGKIKFKISLLQPLEKIASDQADYRRKNNQEILKKSISQRHIKLGNRFIEINNFKAANEEFKLALSIDPYNNDAVVGVFKALIFPDINNNDYAPEIAKQKIDFLIDNNSKDAHAYYFLGLLYRKIDNEKAINYFNKALKLNLDFPDVYFQLGGIYFANSKLEYDKVLSFYEKALQLSELNPRYLNNVCNMYFLSSKYDEAVPKYELLISLFPNYLLPHLTFSNLLFIKKDFEKCSLYLELFMNKIVNKEKFKESFNIATWIKPISHTKNVFFESEDQKTLYGFLSCLCKFILIENTDQAKIALEMSKSIIQNGNQKYMDVFLAIFYEINTYLSKGLVNSDKIHLLKSEFNEGFNLNLEIY